MSTILGFHSIELIYIFFFFVWVFVFFAKIQSCFFEVVFFVGGVLSPYSISIIPYRQDYLDFYSLYSNAGVLNAYYFWDGFFVAPIYVLSIIVVLKGARQIFCSRDFFVALIGVVTFFATVPLFYSYFFHGSDLDRFSIFLSPLKSFVVFLAFYVSVDSILKRVGLNYFIKSTLLFYFAYAIIVAICISIDVPDWMVWMKYGMKYKFLDQADQFFIFALMLFSVSIFYKDVVFSFLVLILFCMLVLSGGKSAAYYCAACFFVVVFLFSRISYGVSYFSYLVVLFFSWLITMIVGFYEIDISMYTRFHQVQQIFKNYLEDPLLMIWGMGAQKAYYFFDEPVLYDAGAYFSDEENSRYKIGFQMPFLDFFRTSGVVVGFFLLLLISIAILGFYKRNFDGVEDRRVKAFCLAGGYYFVMFGFMSYPFWGGKQALGAAFFSVILKRLSSRRIFS